VPEQTLRDRKRLQTAHAIARTAFDFTRDRGLGGFTIDEVVTEVGVSRRTFANYFSCKEEAVTSLVLEQLHEGIASMPEVPAGTTLLEWVKRLAAHQLSNGMLGLLLQLRDLADRDPALQPYLMQVHAEIRRTAQRIVSDRAGSSASRLTSYIIVGAAYGALSSLIEGSVPLPTSSPEEFVERVFSLLRSGI